MIAVLKTIYHKIRRFLFLVRSSFLYFFSSEICCLNPEEAKETLMQYSPMPKSTPLCRNIVDEVKHDLTVIIPAFNAERWIQQCLDSVFLQETDYSFQVIVVDDGSTDETGRIIDGYANETQIKIIHQDNMGYSGARNVALRRLESKYVMFVDSDDYLLPGAIQVLLSTALANEADIVEGNGFCFGEQGRIGPIKKSVNDKWGGPWLKVIASYLFETVQFPEGYLYEDTIIGTLVFPSANKILMLPDEVYAYRIHPDSITQRHDKNPKRIDSFWIMLLLSKIQEDFGFSFDHAMYINTMQHVVFTYRRIVLLPEKIKKCVFSLTCVFLKEHYSQFLDQKDEFYGLAKAVRDNDYGRYSCFCKYFRK